MYLNTANDGTSAIAGTFQFPCTNSFKEKRLSILILVSCMTNLSKFHIVFSSSAIICFNKDAFEGHLYQTINNFVKQIVEPSVSLLVLLVVVR